MTTTPTPPLALPALPEARWLGEAETPRDRVMKLILEWAYAKPGHTRTIECANELDAAIDEMLRDYATAAILSDRAGRGDAAGWEPIESAPKDGTHILACHAGRPYDDTYTFNQAPPSVVHWFGWPEDAAGFYLSVALGDQKTPFDYTHWKPLGPEPCKMIGEAQ